MSVNAWLWASLLDVMTSERYVENRIRISETPMLSPFKPSEPLSQAIEVELLKYTKKTDELVCIRTTYVRVRQWKLVPWLCIVCAWVHFMCVYNVIWGDGGHVHAVLCIFQDNNGSEISTFFWRCCSVNLTSIINSNVALFMYMHMYTHNVHVHHTCRYFLF